MSCSRITGICTVANEAQNGHSKSEYSVTSIRAESAPSVKPLNPSLAATGSGALAAGVATGAPREPYQITPPPLRPVDLVFVVAHASAFRLCDPSPHVPRCRSRPIHRLIIPPSAAGRGAFARPACAYYIAAPSIRAPTSQPQRGVAPAWPKNVRNPASCRPPPLLSRPATSCSPTSSAVASWKRPPSIRRNGSTTRCCIWPTGTPSWTSRGSRSCAFWASATAGPWWDGARRSAPTPERHTARRSGRSGNGRPVSLPRGPQPPPAAPRGESDPTGEPELGVPASRAGRRGFEAHHSRQVARAALRGGARERDAEPAVQARPRAGAGLEQELRARREPHARRPVVGSARRSQGEAPLPTRAPRHADLPPREPAPRHHDHRTGADLGGREALARGGPHPGRSTREGEHARDRAIEARRRR